MAREGHTSSLNRLYASLRNPTSTLSFPQYARLLSRLTSYTLLLRTLDSIQQSKHDRLLDTVLRTSNESRNKLTIANMSANTGMDMHKVEGIERTVCNCGSDSGVCPCAEGTCACENCSKSDVKTVPGSDKTTCSCGSDLSKCPCAPGHCACISCPKATIETVVGTDKTTCKCGGDANNCLCEVGNCACSGCAK